MHIVYEDYLRTRIGFQDKSHARSMTDWGRDHGVSSRFEGNLPADTANFTPRGSDYCRDALKGIWVSFMGARKDLLKGFGFPLNFSKAGLELL